MKGIGLDKRIGPSFLNAGMAWGGSCFPKDLRAIRAYASEKGVRLDLVEAALSMNDRGVKEVADSLEREVNGLKGKKIAVLGVAFKPDTDDVRESPSLKLIEELRGRGAEVSACDPAASAKGLEVKRGLDCLEGADAAVLVTEWEEYRKARAKEFLRMRGRLVYDTRRAYDPKEFEKEGIRLVQLGRGR